MAIRRHARRALRARALPILSIALLLAVLGTPAAAAPPPNPAVLSAATPPVLAATTSSAGVKRRAFWKRRRAVVRFARAQLGKPYRWGGTGPNGYDCSGLTSAAWARAGRSLPHSSRMQFRSTRRVSRREMKIGDLLFYGRPIHHVAIYVGNGKMIEAPCRGLNVRKASANRSDRVGIGRP